MCTHAHTHRRTDVHRQCMDVYTFAYIQEHMYDESHVHRHTCVYPHACTGMQRDTLFTHTHAYMHAHTHTLTLPGLVPEKGPVFPPRLRPLGF